MKITVVVPAYNEAKTILVVLSGLPKKIAKHAVSVVVVDDGSHDNTAELARLRGARVLRHPINRGQGAALKTGIDYALRRGAEIVVTFDADGQHQDGDVARIVEPILKKRAQVVLGSRFLREKPKDIPYSRLFLLKAGTVFTRVFSGIRVTDTHNGLRAFHANALKQMNLVEDKMEHASEILDQIGQLRLAYEEVPVTISYSPYSLRKGQRNTNALKIALKMIAYKLK